MLLLMNDGARNARLNDTRNVWLGGRLDEERRARREDRVVDRRELVEAAADHPAEMVAEEDLVLEVAAALVAVVAVRRERDVERVVPEVAAVGQHVARADRLHVGRLEVEGVRLEVERQRLPVGAARQQVRGVAVEQVGEEGERGVRR